MSGDDEFMHDLPDEPGLDTPEEFYEEENFAEGGQGETPAEDWESYDSEFTEATGEAADAPPKKVAPNLILMGGVAVAVLFTLIFLATHHKAPPKAVVVSQNSGLLPGVGAAEQAPPSPALTSGQPAPTADANAGPKGGMLNDPQALKGLVGDIQNSAAAAPPAAAASAAPSPASANELTPLPANPPPAPSPAVAQAPASTAAEAPQAPPAISSPAPAAAAATPANATPAQPLPANSAFIKAGSQPAAPPPAPPEAVATAAPLQNGMQQASASEDAKLDQLLDRVSALENKMADLQQMQQSLKQLDDRVSRMEGAKAGSAQSPDAAAPAPAQVTQDLTQPAGAPATPAETSAAQPAPAAPAPHKHAGHPHNADGKSGVHWVLKSAEPGQAYVSPPGRDDMVNIHVGDMLPGVGRITAISESNGQWTVSGTEGKISE